VNTTKAVCRHARSLGVEMPIAAGMHQLLFEGAELADVIHDLMTRISVYEASYSAIHTPATLTNSIVEHAARVSAIREESE
jgi:hypothetical protein